MIFGVLSKGISCSHYDVEIILTWLILFLLLKNVDDGYFVFDVNATDDDILSNGEVTYSIMHGDEDKFVINATSGVITTAGALDRETKDIYTVMMINCWSSVEPESQLDFQNTSVLASVASIEATKTGEMHKLRRGKTLVLLRVSPVNSICFEKF